MATINAAQPVRLPHPHTATIRVYQRLVPPVVTVRLSGLVPGSRYYLFKSATGEVLASGSAATGNVSFNVEYYDDLQVTVRVRKPAYTACEVSAWITATGLDLAISQTLDPVYST